MKQHWLMLGMVITCVVALAVRPGLTAEKSKGKGKAPAGPSQAEMDKMMKMMEQLAMPGKAHKALETRVGMWETSSKMMMGPDTAPSKGSAKVASFYDGRFFIEHAEGSFMGKPFKGHGITGYDNYRKQYQMVWLDNMGTVMLSASGNFDRAGKVLTLVGKMDEPTTGEKDKTVKYVYKFESKDKIIFQMVDKPKMKGAKEFVALEVTYSRKK